eukprot:2970932-Ditylum_brightwellii.AAC.1
MEDFVGVNEVKSEQKGVRRRKAPVSMTMGIFLESEFLLRKMQQDDGLSTNDGEYFTVPSENMNG